LRAMPAGAIALLAAIALVPLPARGDAWFTQTLLHAPGIPKTVLVTDLDGDGRPDLAAVYAVSVKGRLAFQSHLAAYLQTPAGFRTEPDVTAPLRGGETIIMLAEADASRDGRDLVLLRRGGLSAWSVTRQGGRAAWVEQDRGATEARWIGPDWSGVHAIDLARDLDGDGRDEILIPERDGLLILAAGADGRYAQTQRLDASEFREMGQPDDPGQILDFLDRYGVKQSETFPEIHAVDLDADKRTDLVLTYADTAASYRQGPDGRFATSPHRFRSGGAPNVDLMRAAVPPKLVSTLPRDFDGDGRADLLVSRCEVRGLRGIITVDLHRNVNGAFETKSSFRMREEVLALFPFVADFDRDGKLDFTFLQTEFGLKQIINFFLTRRVTFHYEFYLWRGAPAFTPEPVKRKGISVKFDLREAHLSAFPASDVTQDFSGDGVPDFYAIRERDSFAVYFGKPDKSDLFSGDPDIEARVHQSFYHRFADLNGDRRADVIYWYQSETVRKDLTHKILVLTSPLPVLKAR